MHLLPGTTTEVYHSDGTDHSESASWFPYGGNTTHDTRMRSWNFSERASATWCGLRNVLQGASVPLDRPLLSDTATCFSGPGSWTVDDYALVPTGVSGAAPERTASFETRADGSAVNEWVYHEQTPYPVQIRFLSGFIAVYRLASLERGATPIAAAPAVLSPAPATPLLAQRQVWGPNESGVAHPFPLSQAFAQARDDPSYPDLRGFLAQHPDAYVARAGYQESTLNNRVDRGWAMVVTDGGASLGFFINVQWYNVLGERAVPKTHYQPADNWVEGATFLPPGQVTGQLPTVASLMAAWSTLSGRPAADANTWGFDLACGVPDASACTAVAQVSAGRQDDHATGLPAFPVVGMTRTIEQSEVRANGLGTLTHYQEWSSRQQPTFGPLASPHTTIDAKGSSTLEALVPEWTLTPEAAAAAGAGALLIGLAYFFLWPVVKAGGLGLFSRVRTDRLLDNPVRATLHQAIEAQPASTGRTWCGSSARATAPSSTSCASSSRAASWCASQGRATPATSSRARWTAKRWRLLPS